MATEQKDSALINNSDKLPSKADTIDKMNACLAEYYKTLGNDTYYQDDQRGKFKALCEENGYDQEDLQDELYEEDPADVPYIEMDDDFPFPQNVENTIANMVKELQFCYDNGYPSTRIQNNDRDDEKTQNPITQCMKITDYDMTISAKVREQTQKLYEQEPIVKYSIKEDNDITMLEWLAFGIENNDDTFVMNLSMAYVRDMIEYQIREKKVKFQVMDWIKSKSFLNELLDHKQKKQLVLVINAYTGRICPKFSIKEINKIDDSITDVALRIAFASQFVHRLIVESDNTGSSILPHHFDFVIAVDSSDSNSPISPQNDENDDDYDDDPTSDDSKQPCFEVKDIADKLSANELIYSEENNNLLPGEIKDTLEILKEVDQTDQKAMNAVFANMTRKWYNWYVDYKKQLCNPNKKYCKISKTYPRNKRFCLFMKRHNGNENISDSIVIFDPPDQCNSLPKGNGLLAESFLNSSSKCLIPSVPYNEKRNIKVTNACGGKLLTVSFHVVQENEIRCFLFWNGKCLRFYPRDVLNILPECFDMKSPQNRNVDRDILRRIAKCIRIEDYRFEAFYKSLDKHSIPLTDFIN